MIARFELILIWSGVGLSALPFIQSTVAIIAGIAATFASIAYGIYYLKKASKIKDDGQETV
jgi:hypothetical protein